MTCRHCQQPITREGRFWIWPRDGRNPYSCEHTLIAEDYPKVTLTPWCYVLNRHSPERLAELRARSLRAA